MSVYQHNHYVPIWYQKRFMLPGQRRYYRLDLKPEEVTNGGVKYIRNAVHCWAPDRVFAQDDLYTTRWGEVTNKEIEQFFFGKVDADASAALNYFTSFKHPGANEKVLNTFLPYMSIQKLRTPKGLTSLATQYETANSNLTLLLLQQVQNLYCAIWTEAIWQIADALNSATKFIISDHPVTVYNRECPPLSKWCLGHNDPDIRMNATHTFFPLSLDKILILTNLSWVRNPYQNERKVRPNPVMLRSAVFNYLEIQVERMLTEDEVLQINYVTKRRAYRYIAAAEREWLYPEKRVSTDHWKKLGGGYLFMPEPRLIFMGGEVYIGYSGGAKDAFGAYGHKPWEKGFKDAEREKLESDMLERFQAEWAFKHGSKYTARNDEFRGHPAESGHEMMKHYEEVRKRYARGKNKSS